MQGVSLRDEAVVSLRSALEAGERARLALEAKLKEARESCEAARQDSKVKLKEVRESLLASRTEAVASFVKGVRYQLRVQAFGRAYYL